MFPYRFPPLAKRGRKRKTPATATSTTSTSKNPKNSTFTKNNQKKEEVTSTENVLICTNCPLQTAIEQDLLRLRSIFQQALQNHNQEKKQRQAAMSEPGLSVNHVAASAKARKGTVFRIFKRVFAGTLPSSFATTKEQQKQKECYPLALLHSLRPTKADPAAYTQILYSACFSLLHQSFEQYRNHKLPVHHLNQQQQTVEHSSEEESTSLQLSTLVFHAGFAVLCLWSLYETCPFSPSSLEGQRLGSQSPHKSIGSVHGLQWLPMGQTDRTNPRLLYRRSTTAAPRIDRQHYHYLLQIQQAAAAVRISSNHYNCKCSACPTTNSTASLTPSSSNSASCRCSCYGLATDVDAIVTRLLSVVVCTSYTGPCSLEAWVGGRPAPATNTNNKNNSDTTSTTSIKTTALSNGHEWSPNIQQELQHYWTRRQAIRLPPISIINKNNNVQYNRTRRLREALEPMFVLAQTNPPPSLYRTTQRHQINNGTTNQDPLQRLLSTCCGIDSKLDIKTNWMDEQEEELAMLAKHGILRRHARYQMQNLDETEDGTSTSASERTKQFHQQGQQHQTTVTWWENLTLAFPSNMSHKEDDQENKEMPWHIQESIQAAVKTLLERGSLDPDQMLQTKQQQEFETPVEPQEITPEEDDASVMPPPLPRVMKKNRRQTSTTSEVKPNDDDVSVSVSTRVDVSTVDGEESTQSRVGRYALKSLLHAASASTQKKAPSTKCQQTTSGRHQREQEPKGHDGTDVVEPQSRQVDEESHSVVSGVGRAALKNLLAQASSSTSPVAARRRTTKTSTTRPRQQQKKQNPRTVTRTTRAVHNDEDAASVGWTDDPSESGVSAIGQNALQNLLAQVDRSFPDTHSESMASNVVRTVADDIVEKYDGASAVGQGALQNLLTEARQEKEPDTHSVLTESLTENDGSTVSDGVTRAATDSVVGGASHAGQTALENLLAQANDPSDTSTMRSSYRTTRRTSDKYDKNSSDSLTEGASASAVGKKALQDLLSRAGEERPPIASHVDTRLVLTESMTEGSSAGRLEVPNDGNSVAGGESAIGQNALQALLAQTNQTKALNTSKLRKRKEQSDLSTTSDVGEDDTNNESLPPSLNGTERGVGTPEASVGHLSARTSAVGQATLRTLLAQAGRGSGGTDCSGTRKPLLVPTESDARSIWTGESVSNTTFTGIGRSALQHLLTRASKWPTKTRIKSSDGRSHSSWGQSSDFLAMGASDDDEIMEDDNDKIIIKRAETKQGRKESQGRGTRPSDLINSEDKEDDLSDLSDDGAASISAVSTVGRRALSSLFEYGQESDDRKSKRPRKRNR